MVEFKNLRMLFVSDRKVEHYISLTDIFESVVLKGKLSVRAKLVIVVLERIKSHIQAAEMTFLQRLAWFYLRDKVRISVI